MRYARTPPDQEDLFSADTQYVQFVGDDNFYGFLARHSRKLFRNWDFAKLYCPDFGRSSSASNQINITILVSNSTRESGAPRASLVCVRVLCYSAQR